MRVRTCLATFPCDPTHEPYKTNILLNQVNVTMTRNMYPPQCHPRRVTKLKAFNA